MQLNGTPCNLHPPAPASSPISSSSCGVQRHILQSITLSQLHVFICFYPNRCSTPGKVLNLYRRIRSDQCGCEEQPANHPNHHHHHHHHHHHQRDHHHQQQHNQLCSWESKQPSTSSVFHPCHFALSVTPTLKICD